MNGGPIDPEAEETAMIPSTLTPRALFAPVLATLLTLGLVACQGPSSEPTPEEKPAPTLPRIESPDLGIAIGALPAVWTVETNQGSELRLAHHDADGTADGELWFEVRKPAIGGVNLVDMIKEAQASYESMPQGSFHGQVELGTQFGTAFSVRGRFEQDGQLMEERQIFSVHPDDRDKALVMVYRYPAGEDSRPRTEEMLNLFTELESLAFQQGGGEEEAAEG